MERDLVRTGEHMDQGRLGAGKAGYGIGVGGKALQTVKERGILLQYPLDIVIVQPIQHENKHIVLSRELIKVLIGEKIVIHLVGLCVVIGAAEDGHCGYQLHKHQQ